jgi:hypothetical protein
MSDESASGKVEQQPAAPSADTPPASEPVSTDTTAEREASSGADVADGVLSSQPRSVPRSAIGRAYQTRVNRRLRARRVRRLVRHVEPWSVLKVSLILYFCAWAIMLFVGVTLWNLAVNSGLVADVEGFVVELFALESFKINADQIFRIAAVGGLVLVLAASGLTVLGAVLFNLISDVTGGVRLTVVEEETARPRPRRARRRVLVAAPPADQDAGSLPGAAGGARGGRG